MQQGPQDYFKPGDWNAYCDVCGFKFKASQLRKRWDGHMVCEKDYEERHPQELIRMPKEDTSVPWSRYHEPTYITPGPIDPTQL